MDSAFIRNKFRNGLEVVLQLFGVDSAFIRNKVRNGLEVVLQLFGADSAFIRKRFCKRAENILFFNLFLEKK